MQQTLSKNLSARERKYLRDLIVTSWTKLRELKGEVNVTWLSNRQAILKELFLNSLSATEQTLSLAEALHDEIMQIVG